MHLLYFILIVLSYIGDYNINKGHITLVFLIIIGQFNQTFYNNSPFPLAINTCYFIIVKCFHSLCFYIVSLDIAKILALVSNKAYIF